ncbi:MAG: VOC family protein [Ruminococcus sp.]|nr:VOC family protein [Candidatus Copronaster equi]
MKLKSFLIVVKDIEKSKRFYQDLFGLEMLADNDGNMILSDGLALQEEKYWNKFIEREVMTKNNSCELYFEEQDINSFVEKLDKLYPETEYVNKIMTHSWGQTVVRFYDPDGNLIEVGTPMQM